MWSILPKASTTSGEAKLRQSSYKASPSQDNFTPEVAQLIHEFDDFLVFSPVQVHEIKLSWQVYQLQIRDAYAEMPNDLRPGGPGSGESSFIG